MDAVCISKFKIVECNTKCWVYIDHIMQRLSWMSQTWFFFQVRPTQFPSDLIKPCHLFSNHSHVSCLIYGAVSVCCYSSVIFSTALFLQPIANPSPLPGCWTILNQILTSEIPSSCQTPFLILSTPMPLHLFRHLGNSSAANLQIITDLVQNQF